ncbi:hypothetical protein EON80_02625 [bacterium]|nr:MAG: hypothetical protein EON80_02625 [bacterium]
MSNRCTCFKIEGAGHVFVTSVSSGQNDFMLKLSTRLFFAGAMAMILAGVNLQAQDDALAQQQAANQAVVQK